MDSMEISVLNSDFHGNSIHIVAFQHGFPDDFVQARFSDDHFWGGITAQVAEAGARELAQCQE